VIAVYVGALCSVLLVVRCWTIVRAFTG
jgi:hypothetical protein